MVVKLSKTAFLSLALLLLSPSVWAQQAATSSISAQLGEAQAIYQQGRRFFKAGETELALQYFQRSHQLSQGRPSTLLAMAQCESILKRYDDALLHYRAYLATEAGQKDQVRVQERIKTVELLQQQAEKKAAQDQARAAAEKAQRDQEAARIAAQVAEQISQQKLSALEEKLKPEESAWYQEPWLWIVVGVVVAGAGTGAGLALSDSGDSSNGGTSGVILKP